MFTCLVYLVRLMKGIASSSTSSISTIHEQTEVTQNVMMMISGALNDKAVCAELLEEVKSIY